VDVPYVVHVQSVTGSTDIGDLESVDTGFCSTVTMMLSMCRILWTCPMSWMYKVSQAVRTLVIWNLSTLDFSVMEAAILTSHHNCGITHTRAFSVSFLISFLSFQI